MCPRPRPHRGRVSFCDKVRTCRRWDCINVRQRERVKEARFAACTSLLTSPSHPQNGAKVRGFSRTASAFTAETDCLLEEGGFELVWGFSCQVVVFGFVAGSLFGAGGPFFVPSPTIRFAERAEGVKGPKR